LSARQAAPNQAHLVFAAQNGNRKKPKELDFKPAHTDNDNNEIVNNRNTQCKQIK